MPKGTKRSQYQHMHADETRRRKEALGRLEVQLNKLQNNDKVALFKKIEATPSKTDFEQKIIEVNKQISTLKSKIR